MTYHDARHKFIGAWGTFGSQWGINRAMAQIHALLLTATEPLSTEDIMRELNISRGNANMNLHGLIDWGLVRRHQKPGERREFFSTTKDIWQLTRQVARERKKRELDPVIALIEELTTFTGNRSAEEKELHAVLTDIQSYAQTASGLFNKIAASDRGWFFKTLAKLVR